MSRYYRVKTLMLKGQKGDTGYGISNVQMNDDYTLTITIENGMQFNTSSIRGEKGERGACIMSAELRDDYSLLFTLDNGETIETTAILGKEFENIRKLEASASSASKIATSASTSASASAQSASEASISASESASNASTSASASAHSATNASQSATNAQESASSASTSADTATSKATEASASATKAKECEMNAKLSETNASNSAKEAEASAVNAKASETKAEEYANNLQNSTEAISQLKEDLVANSKEDAKTKRSLSALWDLNKGISYRFETDTEKAYTKTVPSGAKLGSVNKIGGRTIVYNQYANINGDEILWADDTPFSKNVKNLSNHKLYIMNKCVVTEILYDKETYNKRLILFDENDDRVINVGNTIIKKEDIAVGKVFRNSSIVQAPNVIKRIRLYNIGDDEIGLTAKCNSWVEMIDLTQMFGSGNEPSTTEEFEAMFPNGYYPYSEGTLMSMPINEVDTVGKNLLKCEGISCSSIKNGYNLSSKNLYGTSINSTEPSNSVTVTQSKIEQAENSQSYTNGYFCIAFKPFILNEKYVFSFDITPSNKLISNPIISIFLNGDGVINTIDSQDLQIGKKSKLYFNLTATNKKVIYIEIRNSGVSGVFENFQIERGATNTSYSPYTEKSYPIPQAIQNLDGYGWSTGTAYNYVDFENKKYYKCIEKVDLGTLNFVYIAYGDNDDSKKYGFRVPLLKGIKKNENAYKQKNNLLCYKYPDTPWKDAYRRMDKTISQLSNSIQINDSSFSDAETFKKSLQGAYLYYELAEPIVTDISDIIGDTLQEPFNVESGGSLTFKNTNGDGYQLAVPSDIQYVVSLKEVTS